MFLVNMRHYFHMEKFKEGVIRHVYRRNIANLNIAQAKQPVNIENMSLYMLVMAQIISVVTGS